MHAQKKHAKILFAVVIFLFAAAVIAAAVIIASQAHAASPYEKADMSAYAYLSESDTVFREMTARDVTREIDAGSTFVVVFSHARCPWCNAALPVLEQIAEEEDLLIGYVDTRRDPTWKTNLQIDDYDLLVSRLGEYFPLDEFERPHLYVPHVFFIRDGEVVFQYEGATSDYDGSGDELTEAQASALAEIYREGFDLLAK